MNQYSAIPSRTLSYEGKGNLTSDGFHTYGWDSDSNLITVDGSTGAFDALDRRVEVGGGLSYQQILYPPFDPTDQPLRLSRADGQAAREPL